MEAINNLMYQLSHLQSHLTVLWILVFAMIILNVIMLLELPFICNNNYKTTFLSWLLLNVIVIGFIFVFNGFSNPFIRYTANKTSIEKVEKAKVQVNKEYPYNISLSVNEKPLNKPEVYLMFFKNIDTAKETQSYLNSVTNHNEGDKTVALIPNKNVVILKCKTKPIGTKNTCTNSNFMIENWHQITTPKTITLHNANYGLKPTNKMPYDW